MNFPQEGADRRDLQRPGAGLSAKLTEPAFTVMSRACNNIAVLSRPCHHEIRTAKPDRSNQESTGDGRGILRSAEHAARWQPLKRDLISQRTKNALAASKAQGKRRGGYRGVPKPNFEVGLKVGQERAVAFASLVRPILQNCPMTA